MVTAKECLNALKWRDAALDAAVEVWFVHRGAPGDVRIVRGSEILALHHSFFELASRDGTGMIPYHRVTRIVREGVAVWERTRSVG